MLRKNIPLSLQQFLTVDMCCLSVRWCVCPPRGSYWRSPLFYLHEALNKCQHSTELHLASQSNRRIVSHQNTEQHVMKPLALSIKPHCVKDASNHVCCCYFSNQTQFSPSSLDAFSPRSQAYLDIRAVSEMPHSHIKCTISDILMSETTVKVVIMIHIHNAHNTFRSEFTCWPSGAPVFPTNQRYAV